MRRPCCCLRATPVKTLSLMPTPPLLLLSHRRGDAAANGLVLHDAARQWGGQEEADQARGASLAVAAVAATVAVHVLLRSPASTSLVLQASGAAKGPSAKRRPGK